MFELDIAYLACLELDKMKKVRTCRCTLTGRKYCLGPLMMHYYRLESDVALSDMMVTSAYRICETKWTPCPTKKHIIASCRHRVRGILDERDFEQGGC